VAHALLAELDEPMLSTTLLLPGDEQPLADAQEIRLRLEHELDLVIDAGSCGTEPSTVIDLTQETPLVLRKGKGSLAPFAVEPV
jgi:tRNA A37 threonylcarbamoyladenosine synthetase subunit TsaC/SUA5/YrdC